MTAADPAIDSAHAPALAIRDLRKTYDNGVEALKGVSLEVAPGDFYALLGPNGAGKSTLIGIVSSLVNRSAGEVRVFGVDLAADRDAAMRLIGLVPQEINFNMFEKPFDICVNYAGFYGVPRGEAMTRAERVLREAQLWDKAQVMSRTLSGGMKRRLMIARAMMTSPRLLILDEPTAGVDIEIRRSMWSFLSEINAQGTTIILTTHYLEEAENLCRRIAIIDGGRIIENDRMSNVLRKLHVESFVLNLERPIAEDAPFALDGYEVRRTDATTLEVDLRQGQGLNGVFAALTARGILVQSMRNKVNRLEELFLRLVEDRDGS
jgi:ABC-2 type transport system ATP-binding protein